MSTLRRRTRSDSPVRVDAPAVGRRPGPPPQDVRMPTGGGLFTVCSCFGSMIIESVRQCNCRSGAVRCGRLPDDPYASPLRTTRCDLVSRMSKQ